MKITKLAAKNITSAKLVYKEKYPKDSIINIILDKKKKILGFNKKPVVYRMYGNKVYIIQSKERKEQKQTNGKQLKLNLFLNS